MREKNIDFLSCLFAHYRALAAESGWQHSAAAQAPRTHLTQTLAGCGANPLGVDRLGGSRTAAPQRRLVSNLPAAQINKLCRSSSEQLFLDKYLCASVFIMEYKS